MKIALCIIGMSLCLAITAIASLFIKYCESRMEEERLKDRVSDLEEALADARSELNKARHRQSIEQR